MKAQQKPLKNYRDCRLFEKGRVTPQMSRRRLLPHWMERLIRLQIYVHVYVGRYTEDERPHDHPWNSVSFTLRGRLYEQQLIEVKKIDYMNVKKHHRHYYQKRIAKRIKGVMFPTETVPRIKRRTKNCIHRITGFEQHTMTLMFCWGRTRDWGFWKGSESMRKVHIYTFQHYDRRIHDDG